MKDPKTKKPKVGDDIYVPTSMSISNGSRDVHGGLAKISVVDKMISGGEPTWFIDVEELPNHGFNYDILMERQEELKERFGNERAYPDPDIDTPWIEEGDIVSGTFNGKEYNGEKYHGSDIW